MICVMWLVTNKSLIKLSSFFFSFIFLIPFAVFSHVYILFLKPLLMGGGFNGGRSDCFFHKANTAVNGCKEKVNLEREN